jgi:MFS family permease
MQFDPMEEKPASLREILAHRGFVNLWINQILVQLSYNSMNFALLVWVFRLTESNTAVAALMFAVYLPAVILGLFAGLLVDITDRRKIIRVIDLAMAGCFIALIFLKGSFLAILGITFLVNALGQFYIPAESSAIPLLVKKHQLLAANSLFSITLFASFLLGFGFSGPLIQHLGIDMIFLLGGLMLLGAFGLTFYFPKIVNTEDAQSVKLKQALKRRDIPTFWEISVVEVKSTFGMIRGKVVVMASLLILASVQVAIAILGVLIPSFFEKNLQVNATDASYVLILPLGLGMVLGGIAIGRFGYKIPKRSIVGVSILLAGLLFFLVGAAPLISPAISYFPKPRPLPFIYQPSLSTILAVGSFLLGITMVSVVVPSQTVLQENTPDSVRGKVFSILGVLMSALTLLPVVLVGVLADIFGTAPIFIAIGGTVALLGFMAIKPSFYFDEEHLPYRLRQFLGLGHWKKEN